jgi:hypothetical protein
MTEQADMPEAEAGTVADSESRTLLKTAGRGGGDPMRPEQATGPAPDLGGTVNSGPGKRGPA